jgi:thioredoxin-like negative regulator of GroEL
VTSPAKACLALAACALAGALAPRVAASEAEGALAWSTDIPQALARAGGEGRPVLVDVWAVWCAPCKELEATVYRDPEFVRLAADGFVPLKVDADVHETFLDRHRVDAFPTILVLDEHGREIVRREGLIGTADLMAMLRSIGGGYRAYMESVQRDDDPAALRSAAAFLREVGNAEGAIDVLRRGQSAVAKAEPAVREPLELALAEARLDAGDDKAAAQAFETLAAEAADPAVREAALVGLVRSERARGRSEEAARALERLREAAPERAAEIDSGE